MVELELIAGNRTFPFPSRRFVLGSAPGCDLAFDGMLPRHAEVMLENIKLVLAPYKVLTSQ